MPRPIEYDNLIKTRALEAVQPTPGAVAGFLKNAENFLLLSKTLLAGVPVATEPMQTFTNAYEGYHQLVQAVLEFHEVRTKESGRALAIQRVSADLKLSAPEMAAVIRAHDRRNDTSYRSPFPPLSKADARTMVEILEKYLPVARAITGVGA
ncbi:MAG: hypothetical protein IV097_08545 [Burkholderiaceae bacterium]|uniref:HEPN domain-containing protein n=1 Tax=Roseateles toxinivorans TaxID=270368 RepID=A0A4R6QQ40_9BURK|nr:hypothetical protein [Roseateles toxinivorans]MBT9456657.1 hypothetical protein [Burkholderiaceae bacterium]TDP73136.1 hypothetical protein DES47_102883 [Roseateles toxinivorans]